MGKQDTMGKIFILFLMIHSTIVLGWAGIRFEESSLIPENEGYLTDDSSETCTDFNLEEGVNVPTHTMFRIEVAEYISDYANVTLIGNNLGCGHDLYVLPLIAKETTQWTGRWKTCPLKETSIYEDKERCSYDCQSTGKCEQVQILKRPFKDRDSYWTLCQICVTADYRDLSGCSLSQNKSNGIYLVNIPTKSSACVHPREVYCDMETDGGGWTVLLRRKDGSVDFYREWDVYKAGFGLLSGEFWAGTELIHQLTNDGRTYTLRIDLTNYAGESIFAKYGNFSVGPETDNYRLHVSQFDTNSTASDTLSKHDGCLFSTGTIDNDKVSDNMAQKRQAPWWYCYASAVTLTGRYGKGIKWPKPWSPDVYAKHVVMMIRPN